MKKVLFLILEMVCLLSALILSLMHKDGTYLLVCALYSHIMVTDTGRVV